MRTGRRDGAGRSMSMLLVAVVAVTGSARQSLPYKDSRALGVIGLCSKDGQAIDHGTIADVPFVWRGVSSIPAVAGYNGPGKTATLFAYQPRPGVDPDNWSGAMLTASARYTNPDHPMSQATGGDGPLKDFLDVYPTRWDGLVQLRMYLGAPQQPPYNRTYAATDIRVNGNTWAVVNGGSVPCDAGTATSIETLLLPSSVTNPQASPAATPVPAATSGHTAASPAPAAKGGGLPIGLLGVGAGITLAGALVLVVRGRRRRGMNA